MEAAWQGHVQSMKNLGADYWNGDGLPHDETEAAFWYELAANAGDPFSQFCTGWLYINGRGVKQDKRLGLKWIHKATAQGYEQAINFCKENGYSIY